MRNTKPRRRRSRRTIHPDPRWLNVRFVFQHFSEDDERQAGRNFFTSDSLSYRRWIWLRRAMRETLHPDDRRALEWHFLKGRTYQHCAEKLGVHPTTVSRRIKRNLRKLKRQADSHPDLWPPRLVRDNAESR